VCAVVSHDWVIYSATWALRIFRSTCVTFRHHGASFVLPTSPCKAVYLLGLPCPRAEASKHSVTCQCSDIKYNFRLLKSLFAAVLSLCDTASARHSKGSRALATSLLDAQRYRWRTPPQIRLTSSIRPMTRSGMQFRCRSCAVHCVESGFQVVDAGPSQLHRCACSYFKGTHEANLQGQRDRFLRWADTAPCILLNHCILWSKTVWDQVS
jgi:hypothetical protein